LSLPETVGLTCGALFPIVNPLGGVPVFYALTSGMEAGRRRAEERKTALAMLGLMVGFLLLGRYVLSFFGVTLAALEFAGGLVVARAGWLMVTHGAAVGGEAQTGADAPSVFMTPMAMPLLAGPGALGIVLGLASRYHSGTDYLGIGIGIAAITLLTFLLLRYGERPMRLLGNAGIDAMARILGLIVLAIAVELMFHGFKEATGFQAFHPH
jgi:multiple antibiotic resistance protein